MKNLVYNKRNTLVKCHMDDGSAAAWPKLAVIHLLQVGVLFLQGLGLGPHGLGLTCDGQA